MTSEDKKNLRMAITVQLDTRDKRFMFLKCMFNSSLPDVVSSIYLEGTSVFCAMHIMDYFEKQCMLGSLMAAMNSVFELNLTYDITEYIKKKE